MSENEKNSKKSGQTEEDRLSVTPNLKPFTKYRAIEMGVCGICVVLGLLYLYAHILTLSVLLPIYAVCFCAIPVLQYFNIRTSGRRGFASYLPVLFWSLMSIAVLAAAIAYFVK